MSVLVFEKCMIKMLIRVALTNCSFRYLNPAITCMLGGILPFGACFVEMFFIMSR